MSSLNSYSSLVAIAFKIIKREKKTSYYFLRISLQKRKFEIFCLIYSYFRLLDDIIDAPNLSSDILKKIVINEKQYLTNLYKNKCADQANDQSIHQCMLWYVVDYDISQGFQMQELIFEMFRGFEFDAEYRYKICSQDMLDLYTTTAGKVLVNYIWYFTNQECTPTNLPNNVYLGGVGAQRTHNIRDFFIDYELGYYYAIRQEELDKISISNILDLANNPNWVRKEIELAEKYILQGLAETKQVGNLRFRIFVFSLSAKYLSIIQKIRLQNYSLSPTYKFSSMDELRMNLWVVLHSLF